MAVTQLDKVFLGHTPADQRKFLTAALRFLKDKFPVIFLPACGQFTLAKCAIEAGYDKANIHCSDMSLYSSLLGYLYSNKPIDLLGVRVAPEYEGDYRNCVDDFDKASFLIWLMKISQMNPTVFYEKVVYDDLIERKGWHIANIRRKLTEYNKYYNGINYDIADMRNILMGEKGKQAITVVNPPVFRNGYTKMFNFKGNIIWDSGILEFDFYKEYRNFYQITKSQTTPHIWYRFRDTKGFDWREVIFSKEYDADKHDYWLLTKPDVLDKFNYTYTVEHSQSKGVKPYPAPLFTDKDTLTKDSTIRFVPVEEEVAI